MRIQHDFCIEQYCSGITLNTITRTDASSPRRPSRTFWSPVFTFDQLRSFVTLADELHFGRAAERLNMTQPPLSRQIQKLEQELGFTLFDRTKKRVELTHAGRAFAPEAEKLLTMAAVSSERAKRIARGAVGQLRIGITASGTLALLGEILERLDTIAPGVEVSIDEMVSRGQIAAVERGAIDLAFVRTDPKTPSLSALTVVEEPLVAAISRRHRLAVTSRELPVEDLADELVLRYHPQEAEYFRTLVAQALAGIETRPSQQLTQIHSMLSLVAANRGIALVPQSASQLGMPGVVYRPLGGGGARVQLRAVWRTDNSNPVLGSALTVLHELHDRLGHSKAAVTAPPSIPARY